MISRLHARRIALRPEFQPAGNRPVRILMKDGMWLVPEAELATPRAD